MINQGTTGDQPTKTKQFYTSTAILLALLTAMSCVDSREGVENDGNDGGDNGTAADGDSDGDSDGDADTDTDTDTDTSSFDAGIADSGLSCDNPIQIPPNQDVYEFSDYSARYPLDNFDGSLEGCANGTGSSIWFAHSVPPEETLHVSRTAGVQVAVNLIADCESTSCLHSGFGQARWVNSGTVAADVMVAVEPAGTLTNGTIELRFVTSAPPGPSCDEARLLDGPFPMTLDIDIADLLLNSLPTDCGMGSGPSAWFTVSVPPAARLEFEETALFDTVVGYSLDCLACGAYSDTPESFEYSNTTDQPVEVHVFAQPYYSGEIGQMTIVISVIELPDGDGCGNAVALDAASLPHVWQGSSTAYSHMCSDDICPGTTGPDVWHSLVVPAGDVLIVEQSAGPEAYIAALGACADTTSLAHVSGTNERLIWQNMGSADETVFVVFGAVSGTSLATMEVSIYVMTPDPGDFCGSAIPFPTGNTSWNHTGTWSELGDYYEAGTDCGTAAGKEVWYRVEIPAARILRVRENTAPSAVVIQVLETCDATSCLTYAESGTANALNPDATSRTVYVAAEATAEPPTSAGFDLTFAIEEPPPGDLCLNPLSIDAGTDGGEVLWDTGNWSGFVDSETLDGGVGCFEAHGRDVWFEVAVPAGQKVTIEELDAVIPTAVQVVAGCDDADPCLYSGANKSHWYNTTDDDPASVIVAVEAVNANTTSGDIEVRFTREAIPQGDACNFAIEVDAGALPYSGAPDLTGNGAAWPDAYCLPAEGADVWYEVDVPAGKVISFEENSNVDTVVYLSDTCPTTGCLVSAQNPDEAHWYNSGTSPVSVYAVAAAASATDNDETLDVDLTIGDPTDGDFCAVALDITAQPMPYTWPGDLAGFTHGYQADDSAGCASAGGAEVWFEVSVKDGEWLSVANSGATTVAIQIIDACDADDCISSGTQSIFWQNDTGADAVVLVAVEAVDPASAGAVSLEFETLDIPPTMFGPDDFGYFGVTDSDMSICADISSSGTLISTMGDETSQEVNLGFNFTFYGQSYSSAWVNSNGFLTFSEFSGFSTSNSTLPTSTINQTLVSPFWDDLDATISGDVEGVFYTTRTAGSQQLFQVQYKIVPYYSLTEPTGIFDFSVILEESTRRIHFCYVDTSVSIAANDLGASATSGIQQDSTVGLQYSYNEAKLTDGLHIWFVAP